MNRTLVCDHTRCSGCRSCEIACSFHHFGECNTSLARLTVVAFNERGLFVPEICRHCKSPWCMNACPVNAVVRDAETGAIVIVAELCTGCRACADACPFGVIKVNPAGDVFKCDLCHGNPACVKVCTTGALKYVRPAYAYAERAAILASKSGGVV